MGQGLSVLTGKDALIINGNIFQSVGDGNWVEAAFPSELMKMKIGKNGNVIYAQDFTGFEVDITVRLLIGSPDDKFLNSVLATMLADASAFTLMTGTYTKRVGDGQGNFNAVVYQLSGGIFKNWPDAHSSAEGDVEQSVSVYKMKFTILGGRTIQ